MKWMKQSTASLAITAIGLSAFVVPAGAEDRPNDRNRNPGADRVFQSGRVETRTERTLGQVERANKLIGEEVRTSDGQRVGKLENLVVDLESGRVLYAIVGSGGVIKAGERRLAVAPGSFSQAQDKNVVLNVDRQRLNDAPQFTKDLDRPEELHKADFVSKVHKYYGQNAWWQGPNRPAHEGSFHNVHKVTDAIGMRVKDVNNGDLAKVENIVVDLPAGRVVYVILSADRSLNVGDNYYALPPDALTLSPDHRHLVTGITRDKLVAAPHFAKDRWPTMSSASWGSQVYQYYGKQAYFESGGRLQPTSDQERERIYRRDK